MMQHDDAVAQPHQHPHDMLDNDDGELPRRLDPLQHRECLGDLGRGQPGHHLVEQQQPRRRRQRAGDLEPLAAGQGQRLGRLGRAPAEPDLGQDVVRDRPRLRLRALAAAAIERGCGDVVEHRQGREGADDLEGAGDAEPAHPVRPQAVDPLPVEMDGAAARPQIAGDQPEGRGLAGAVGAHQPEDRAFLHREAQLVDRDHAAEALADPLEAQERHAQPASRRSRP